MIIGVIMIKPIISVNLCLSDFQEALLEDLDQDQIFCKLQWFLIMSKGTE